MNETEAGPSGNALVRAVRNDWGRLIAALTHQFGDLSLAEDALQDALEIAWRRWPADGVPANPAGWLFISARRRIIDQIRRARTFDARLPLLADEQAGGTMEDSVFDMDEIPDERLRLIFTCCHPALSQEAQIVLTLRTLGGLTTEEIAHALLVPEPTVGQRISRAKRKIREAAIPFTTPEMAELPNRLASVLTVLYLIYNEGYVASNGVQLARNDLAVEAIRLARMLVLLMPDEPEAIGLLALMLLNHSRVNARTAEDGTLLTLDQQDRSRWDASQIAEGSALVEKALRMRRIGPYQIQAAVSALHAEATSAGETDWPQIVKLYDLLLAIYPTPVIALNRAAAISMASGPLQGLLAMAEIDEQDALDSYYLFHAARADMLRRAGKRAEARSAYEQALTLTNNNAERGYLALRAASLR